MRRIRFNWFYEIIILFCFFVYFFPFKAYGFDPRLLVFVIYAFFIVKDRFLHKKGLKTKYVKILLFPALMAMFTVISSIVNMFIDSPLMDVTYLIFPLQLIYLLILTYCIYYITKRLCKTINFNVITRYFLLALVVQSVIAVIMFVNEPICSFLFDLQGIDRNSRTLEMYFGLRLIGLGCFYFGAGAIYGLGLISIVPLMLQTDDKKQLTQLMLLYVYLFVIGLFFARTSLAGAALSFVYLFSCLFIPKYRNKVVFVSTRFLMFLGIMGFVLVTVYTSSPKLQDKYESIINFGFEAFINLSESGEFSTKSSDGLKEYHLNIWPQTPKTYFIGDTRWTEGEGYYGDSDVGYVRLLYYFGIPGLILFMLYQYSVVKIISSNFRDNILARFFLIIFFYEAILLIKGYIDIAALMFIYIHYSYLDFRNDNSILRRRIK